MTDGYVSLAAAARAVGIGRGNLTELVRRGLVPAHYWATHKHPRFVISEVRAALATGTNDPHEAARAALRMRD